MSKAQKAKPKNSTASDLAARSRAVLQTLVRGFDRCNKREQDALFSQMQEKHIYHTAVILFLRLSFFCLADQRSCLTKPQARSFRSLLKQRNEAATTEFVLWSQLRQLFHSFPWCPPDSQLNKEITLRDCSILSDQRLQLTNAEIQQCLNALVQTVEESHERVLPVEKLGSIYECLLDHTVVKVEELSVILKCSKQKLPLESLQKLRSEFAKGPLAFRDYCLHRSGRADRSLQKDLDALPQKEVSADNPALFFMPLLKATEGGDPILFQPQSLYLVDHSQRRQSGTHYTPAMLTKQVVERALSHFSPVLGKEGKAKKSIFDRRVCDIAMGSGAFLLESCRYLAKFAQVDAKPSEVERSQCKQRIAQSCLYGVDVNVLAVDIAKCSLWLEVANPKLPLSFLDGQLKVGDSLLGLPFQHSDKAPSLEQVEEGLGTLQKEAIPTNEMERLAADAWIGIQLKASSQKRAVQAFESWLKLCRDGATFTKLRNYGDRLLRQGKYDLSQKVTCFHWTKEFPSIFHSTERWGFDAIVGNPPFLGGRNISASFGKSYNRWLTRLHPGSSGEADLVAHFLRRAFDLLSATGIIGIVAKEIISQGETRLAGLQYLVDSGATLFSADTDIVWPGPAAVSISFIHLSKAPWSDIKTLNGTEVSHISPFLGNEIIETEPHPLKSNKGGAFQGVIPHSTGFEFKKNGNYEQSFQYMEELIAKDSRNRALIQPYIGGEDLNESLNLEPSRFIVNFGDRSEAEARKWPDLFSLIERRVKPDRLASKSKEVNDYPFWKYWRQRKKLYRAIEGMDRVLATNAQASVYLCFAFLDAKAIFQNSLNIFKFSDYASFAVLQSSIHSLYSWFLCSNLGAGIRYNPTDCYITFPFPRNWKNLDGLQSAGRDFYEARAQFMADHKRGLTKVYEQFHSPLNQSKDIRALRSLHRELDFAVLAAYQWDTAKDHGFYDHGYGERYSFSPKTRKRLLAQVLELNEQRSQSENDVKDI